MPNDQYSGHFRRVGRQVFSEAKERCAVFLTSALQQLVFVIGSVAPLLAIYKERSMWKCVATEAMLQLSCCSGNFEGAKFESDGYLEGSYKRASDDSTGTVIWQHTFVTPSFLGESSDCLTMAKKSTTGKLLGKRLHWDIFVDFCRLSVAVHR